MLYRIFGLSVASDQPVPGLAACETSGLPDVQLRFHGHPSRLQDLEPTGAPLYVSAARDASGVPALIVTRLAGGEYFRLQYRDGTEFVADRQGTRVWASWREPSTLDDTATYLLGPVLGFLLRLRGVTCLHASAVAIDGHALVLVGPPSAGKSTTAAAFARRGLPVLADDLVALEDRGTTFQAQPAFPRLRLWPESVTRLYGTPDALPRLTPSWEKRGLDLLDQGCHFQREPLPILGIYALDSRSESGVTPLVEGMRPSAALLALAANTSANYLLDSALRAREFEVLSRLIAAVPIRRVRPHADAAHLGRLCDVILEDHRRLASYVHAL